MSAHSVKSINHGLLPDQPIDDGALLPQKQEVLEPVMEGTENDTAKNPLPTESVPTNFHEQVDQLESELKEERKRHAETAAILEREQERIHQMREHYNRATNELDRMKRQNQGSDQLTDEEVHQKGRGLRADIRDFVISCFEKDQRQYSDIPRDAMELFSDHLEQPLEEIFYFLRSPDTRCFTIQSFIWRYIFSHIFDCKFCWAPEKQSKAMRSLVRYFGGLWPQDGAADSEYQRRFHLWRANTTSFIWDYMNVYEENPSAYGDTIGDALSEGLVNILGPFSLSKKQILRRSIQPIISQALELDELFVKQVAYITWTFPSCPCPFDPEHMVLGHGQNQRDGDEVIFILSPRLSKRGKSTGEAFDKEITIMETEVVCRSRDVKRPEAIEPDHHHGGTALRSKSSQFKRALRKFGR